jgi:outer membrane protein TolC
MASWPVFTGGTLKKDLARSRYQLERLVLEERHLTNQIHLNVRASLETAAVSAREISLADNRLAAARKSFDIVQAGYAQGRNSVTDLIDAQNARVSSERDAASAKYQFVIDFLEMERATGRFYFLESPEEKQAFLHRLKAHLETTPHH